MPPVPVGFLGVVGLETPSKIVPAPMSVLGAGPTVWPGRPISGGESPAPGPTATGPSVGERTPGCGAVVPAVEIGPLSDGVALGAA